MLVPAHPVDRQHPASESRSRREGRMKNAAKKRDKKAAPKGDAGRKLKRKAYDKELRRLQAELCHLQEWVKATGQRIVVVFEGRDAAGKGGTLKAISERVSP